jgi:hypothetical protein
LIATVRSRHEIPIHVRRKLQDLDVSAPKRGGICKQRINIAAALKKCADLFGELQATRNRIHASCSPSSNKASKLQEGFPYAIQE